MTWTTPLLVFVGLLLTTGAMRLVELAVSMGRMRKRSDAIVAEPTLFPLMATLHAGLVFAPIVEVIWLDRPFVWWIGLPAVVALVGATVLRVWTLQTIGRAWNVRVVVPEESTIVSTGPYRFIRHPNYLVVILEIAALPLIHTAVFSAIGLTALNAYVLYHRIRTEEEALMQLPAWREAMADRKRLIPGIF